MPALRTMSKLSSGKVAKGRVKSAGGRGNKQSGAADKSLTAAAAVAAAAAAANSEQTATPSNSKRHKQHENLTDRPGRGSKIQSAAATGGRGKQPLWVMLAHTRSSPARRPRPCTLHTGHQKDQGPHDTQRGPPPLQGEDEEPQHTTERASGETSHTGNSAALPACCSPKPPRPQPDSQQQQQAQRAGSEVEHRSTGFFARAGQTTHRNSSRQWLDAAGRRSATPHARAR